MGARVLRQTVARVELASRIMVAAAGKPAAGPSSLELLHLVVLPAIERQSLFHGFSTGRRLPMITGDMY